MLLRLLLVPLRRSFGGVFPTSPHQHNRFGVWSQGRDLHAPAQGSPAQSVKKQDDDDNEGEEDEEEDDDDEEGFEEGEEVRGGRGCPR